VQCGERAENLPRLGLPTPSRGIAEAVVADYQRCDYDQLRRCRRRPARRRPALALDVLVAAKFDRSGWADAHFMLGLS
jgi:hypothetical protein